MIECYKKWDFMGLYLEKQQQRQNEMVSELSVDQVSHPKLSLSKTTTNTQFFLYGSDDMKRPQWKAHILNYHWIEYSGMFQGKCFMKWEICWVSQLD